MGCPRCGHDNAPGATFCRHCGLSFGHGSPAGAAVAFGSAGRDLPRPGGVTALAVLNGLGATLYLLLGLVLVFVKDERIGPGLALFMMGLGTLAAFLAIGLWTLRGWGRTLQIAVSCFGLLGFPLGTLISALILYYLTRPGIRVAFSEKPMAQLTPDERMSLQQASGMGAIALILVGIACVAILGILAAIAIPNFLHAVERAKQKRTIADMRTIADSLETYERRHFGYPRVDSLEELFSKIEIEKPVRNDGWEHELRYASDGRRYWLASAGKDGKFETDDVRMYEKGSSEDFNADIVIVSGKLYRAPAGVDQP